MKLRRDFLNWRPDMDDFGENALTTAQNVLHEPEGWKPIHLVTTTSFSTTGGLAASTATVLSLVAKPVGTADDLLCAWISNSATPTLQIGINGVTATTSSTGYPLSFATVGSSHEIYAFDVCEYDGKIFFTVEARQSTAVPDTVNALRHTGYITF